MTSPRWSGYGEATVVVISALRSDFSTSVADAGLWRLGLVPFSVPVLALPGRLFGPAGGLATLLLIARTQPEG